MEAVDFGLTWPKPNKNNNKNMEKKTERNLVRPDFFQKGNGEKKEERKMRGLP
jgi:hypothetical protein